MTNYRKIYEQYYGFIPVDDTGRTFEIHHIDGNRANNVIENLKAVSIKEHYEIHHKNGDYAACWGIASRLGINREEKSKLISQHQKKLVAEGRHHFLDKEKQSRWGKIAASSGKTPKFTKDNIFQRKAQETHKKMVNDGKHPFQLNHSSQIQWICEMCGKSGKGASNYKRYHGKACKYVK